MREVADLAARRGELAPVGVELVLEGGGARGCRGRRRSGVRGEWRWRWWWWRWQWQPVTCGLAVFHRGLQTEGELLVRGFEVGALLALLEDAGTLAGEGGEVRVGERVGGRRGRRGDLCGRGRRRRAPSRPVQPTRDGASPPSLPYPPSPPPAPPPPPGTRRTAAPGSSTPRRAPPRARRPPPAPPQLRSARERAARQRR